MNLKKTLSLGDILDLEIDTDCLRLELKFMDEVYSELIRNRQSVSRSDFNFILLLRWLYYCKSN